MAISGKRKVAMLLANLDAATATELLRDQPQEVVEEIAMELSHLDVAGQTGEEGIAAVRDFCTSLQRGNTGGLNIKSFINSVLKGSSKEKTAEMREQMQQAIREKDPFVAIASASPMQIAAALQGEPPQAVALVISSLPPKMGTDVLARLNEDISLKTVWRMARPGEVSLRTIRRIGEMICKKLVELTSDDEAPLIEEALPKEMLRKVALVLSGLEKKKRDSLLEEIGDKDADIVNTVKALMVTWEDIPKIEDRSLQEALRKIDATLLAKALYNADPIIVHKIRSNISERAAQMVDEETSLMAEPRKKEILEAREDVAKPLREANEAENLAFIEED